MKSITVVIPLTRQWRIQPMADQIYPEIQNYEHQIIIICDNNHIPKHQILESFPNATIKYTEKDPAGEINFSERRQRITDVMNLARNLTLDTDYTWIIEDDTQLPPNTLQQLYDTIQNPKQIISAVQAGRHGFKIIGAWNTPPNTKNPEYFETIKYQPTGQQQVTATGLYCLLIPTHLFKTTPFRTQLLGPDVYYGIDLTIKGYKLIINWDIKCGHITGNQEQQHTIHVDENCIATSWTLQKDGRLQPKLLE